MVAQSTQEHPTILQNRVVASAAIGMLVVGIIVALAVMWPLYDEIRDREERALLLAVEARADALGKYLGNIRGIASQIASRTKARERLEAYNAGKVTESEFTKFSAPILQDALGRSSAALGITRLDVRNTPVLSFGAQIEAAYWPVSPHSSTRTLVGPPMLAGNPPLIAVAAPILDRTNNRVGTDIVVFNASPLNRIMSVQDEALDGSRIVLAEVGADGSRLITSAAAAGMSDDIDLSPNSPFADTLQKAGQGERGVSTSDTLGAVIAYVPVAGTPWALAVSKADAEFHAPLERQLTQLTVLLLLLIVAGTAGVIALVRPLSRRIVNYSQELESEVARRTQAENALREVNAEIEQRIELRTQELVEANASLEREIEARKQTEFALDEARKMAEQANRAKSEFLANMSHELRTPLNAIIGYAELLLEEYSDGKDNTWIADLKKIHSAGSHLLDVINDVLDLSKIEAGHMEVEASRVDLEALVADVISVTHPLVERNSNVLEMECGADIDVIWTDAAKLRQILLNVVGNAAKFTRDGRIRLKIRRVSGKEGDSIVFRVEDDGIGMTAEQTQRIFEPFTQADQTTSRDYGGTGLGLTITQRFCQALGGTVSVESEPGSGSVFTVQLPSMLDKAHSEGDLHKAPTAPGAVSNPAPEKVKASSALRGGELVLVVDDDPVAVELLSRHLVQLGCKVISALNAESALRMAKELKPDVITLDVMMPDLDGWECLQQLKADPSTERIPVVLCTIVDDLKKGYALGAADYLRKPIERDRLAEILSQYRSETQSGVALVVEDDASAREIVCRALKRSGWTAVEVANGRDALALIEEQRPDVILLDIKMPVMNGFEFLDRLRGSNSGRKIPVIVITAAELRAEDRERLRGAVIGVLQKGAQPLEELLDTINELVAENLSRKWLMATN